MTTRALSEQFSGSTRLLAEAFAAATYSISGTITADGDPLAGVTVSTGAVSDTTDGAGVYTLTGLSNGSYTVTPTLAGYTFTPASRSVTVSGANVTGQNFAAEAVALVFPAPREPLRVVVVQLDIGGDTHYFSDAEYGAPDPLTGIGTRWHDARITGDIAFSRAGDCVFWGRGRTSGLGNIELVNTDGALDDLLAGSLESARVRVYEVEQDQPMAYAVQLAAAKVARIEARGEQAVRIVTEDALAALDVPLQDDLYTATPAGGTLEGRPRPVAIGDPLSCPIVLVDEVSYEYDVHDGPGFDVLRVRDSGIELTPVTQWQISGTAGIDGVELLQVPAGQIVADLQTSALTGTELIGAAAGDFDTDLSAWTITTTGAGTAVWASPGVARLQADSTAGAASARLVFPTDIVEGQRIGWEMAVDVDNAEADPIAAEALQFARFEVLFVPTVGDPIVLRTITIDTAATIEGTYTTPAEGRFGFRVISSRGGIIDADVDGVRVDLLPVGNAPSAVLEAMLARGDIGAERIHQPSLAALDTERPWSLAYYTADATTCREVLQQALDSLYGWAFEDNTGLIRVGWLQPPTGSPVLDLTVGELAGEVEVDADLAPGLALPICGQRNWYVYNAGELADAVTDADRALLTADFRVRRDPASPISTELRRRLGRRTSAEAKVGLPTLLSNATDIQTAADYIATLYPETGRRRFYRLPVFLSRTSAATLNPGDLIRFTYDRFGCDAGRLLRVVAVEGRAGEDLVTITAWGAA